MFKIVLKGESKYLKYLLLPLIIVGIIGAYVIPQQYTFADEGQMHEVTFYDFYNNPISVQEVLHGNAAIVPDESLAPAPPGYRFSGWSVLSLGAITAGPLLVYAQYELINPPGGISRAPAGGTLGVNGTDGEEGGFQTMSGASGTVAFDAGIDGNLHNFLTGFTIKDVEGTVIKDDSTVYYGEKYFFNFQFSERTGDNGQFIYNTRTDPVPPENEFYLQYQLPSQMEVLYDVEKGEIKLKNGKVVGWYNVSKDTGMVEVWFGNFDDEGNPSPDDEDGIPINFIDMYANVSFELNIEAEFTGNSGPGTLTFGTGSSITVNLQALEPKVLISKDYSPLNHEDAVHYTVVITAPESNRFADPQILDNIKIVDFPRFGVSTFLNGGTATADPYYTNIIYTLPDGTTKDITTDVVMTGPTSGAGSGDNRVKMTYSFPEDVTLNPGESIVLTYTIDLEAVVERNKTAATTTTRPSILDYNFNMINEITVSTNGDLDITDDDEKTKNVVRQHYIAKTGVRGTGAQINQINWISTIGNDNGMPMNGNIITDELRLADETVMPDPKDIKITFYNMPSATNIAGWNAARIGRTIDGVAAFTFTADEFGDDFTISSDGKRFDFKVPDALTDVLDGSGQYEDIYRVVIEYATEFIPPATGEPEKEFENTVTYKEKPAKATVKVWPPALFTSTNLSKTAVGGIDANGNRIITWTATVGNGSQQLNGQIITDMLGDFMTFPDASAINIRFWGKPTGTNATDGTVQFTDNDRIYSNSTSGGPSATDLNFPANLFPVSGTQSGKFVIDNESNSFTFTVPDEGSTAARTLNTTRWSNNKWPEIYRITITYTTTIAAHETGYTDNVYRNGIGIGEEWFEFEYALPPAWDKSTGRIKDIGGGEYGIEYTVNIHVPAGWQGKTLYFRDVMSTIATYGYIVPAGYTNSLEIKLFDPDGSEDTSLTYRLVNHTDNFWYLLFGFPATQTFSTSQTTLNNSKWQYNTAKTLTITYTFPLSLITNSGHVEDTPPVLEYLQRNPSNYIRNYAVLYYQDLNNPGTTVPINEIKQNFDSWPIHKSVKVSAQDEAVFNYKVILTGHGTASYRTRLFEAGKPAIFTDTFDDRLEYVPGSLYVVYRAADTADTYKRIFVPVNTAREEFTTVSTNSEKGETTITVDFNEFFRVSDYAKWKGTVESSQEVTFQELTNTSTSSTVTASNTAAFKYWYAEDQILHVYYQLRVKDVETIADGEYVFPNKATVASTRQDTSFSSESSIDFEKKTVTKEMITNDGKFADVEIIINPNGMKLVSDQADEPDRFTAKDTMSKTLSLYLNSIELSTYNTVTGDWEKQTISGIEGDIWSFKVTTDPETDETITEYVLPDSTPVKITYRALILATPWSDISFRNDIEVLGFADFSERINYQIKRTDAGADAGRMPITLTKLDSDTSNLTPLKSATFDLFMAVDGGGYYGSGVYTSAKGTITYPAEGGQEFYYVQSGVTGANGQVVFSSPWLSDSFDATYLIVETGASDETYILPVPPYNYHFFTLKYTGQDKIGDLPLNVRLGAISVYNVKKDAESVYLPLSVNKQASVAMAVNQFEFTLYKSNSAGAYNDPDDVVERKKNTTTGTNSTIDFTDVEIDTAGTHYFVIKETTGKGGGWEVDTTEYHVEVTVEREGNKLVIKDQSITSRLGSAGEFDTAATTISFSNTFRSTKWTPRAIKTATGKDMISGQFSFALYECPVDEATRNPKQSSTPIQTKSNGAVTDNSAYVEFDEIPLTNEGEFYYIMHETSAGGGGWATDDTEYLIKVIVGSNSVNGALEASVEYISRVKPGPNDPQGWSVPEGAGWILASGNPPKFENKYTVGTATAVLEGAKAVTGATGTTKPFTFDAVEVTAPNGDVLVAGGKTGSGTVNGADEFKINIYDLDPGTYYFKVSERVPAGPALGWEYSDNAFWATVVVTDTNGTATAVVTYNDGARTFTNTYEMTSGSVTFPVTKVLDGIASTNVAFTFNAVQVDSAGANRQPVAGGLNGTVSITGAGSGNITITGLVPKTYYFELSEAGGTASGFTYSTQKVLATVVVEDNGDGTVSVAAPTYDPATPATPTFTNKYTPGNINAQITGTKALTGIASTDKEFTFNAVQVTTPNGNTLTSGGKSGTIAKSGEGSFTITIENLALGTYYFRVSEDQTGTGSGGWTYDSHPFWATIAVTNAGDGTAIATVTYNNGSTTFTNEYSPGSASASISGTKTLEGIPSTTKVFTFNAEQVTGLGSDTLVTPDGKTASATTTGEDSFTIELTGLAPGTHYFRVSEEQTVNDTGGWTYSQNAFWVTIEVTDNNDGTAKSEVIYSMGSVREFVNEYDATGTLTLYGMKYAGIVSRVGLTEEVEFTSVDGLIRTVQFFFSVTDVNNVEEDPVTIGASDIYGNIIFNPINYSLADLELDEEDGVMRKLFEYEITEDAPKDPGYIAMTSKYTIFVLVEDNQDGTLKITVYEDEGMTEEITFEAPAVTTGTDGVDEEDTDDGTGEDGTGETDTPATAAYLTFENAKWYDAALRKWVSGVNTQDEADLDTVGIPGSIDTADRTTVNGEPSPPVRVTVGDYVEYTIRVFNQCPWSLIVESVVDNLPDGLAFDGVNNMGVVVDENPQVFDENADWELRPYEDPITGETIYRLYYTGEMPTLDPDPNRFAAGETGTEETAAAEGFYHDIYLVLQVLPTARAGAPITNAAMITGITDDEGTPVADIDSYFDEDGLDDLSDVVDNDVEDDGIGGGDRDEHDIAIIFIEGRLSVEVHKDTIRRTSAAFDGTDAGVKADGDLIDNVGEPIERYRYDIHFRSTANVDADEFLVEDPLEAVKEGKIRIDGLWTPAVWGDMDGKYNIWYKESGVNGYDAIGDFGYLQPITHVPADGEQVFPTNGWKLWTTIDQSGSATFLGTGVITRVNLGLPAGLTIGGDDYITDLRFEFGAVKRGFTSRNNEGNSLNTAAGGEAGLPYRFTNGSGGLVDPPAEPVPGQQVNAGLASMLPDDMAKVPAMTAFASSPFGYVPATAVPILDLRFVSQDERPGDLPGQGESINWTPESTLSNFPTEKADGENLKAAKLGPVSYLVSAVEAMDDVNIVSSASAFIALNGAMEEALASKTGFVQVLDVTRAGALYDMDQDAVLTRVIVPIEIIPNIPDPGSIAEENSFLENARLAGLEFRDGVWYDSKGRRVQTGDMFAISLWIVLAAVTVFCLVLLMRTFFAVPGKRGKKKDIVPAAGKGGDRR